MHILSSKNQSINQSPLCRSVRRSFRPSITFFSFRGLWSHCSRQNDQVTSNSAPAHPHATGLAVYPTSFVVPYRSLILLLIFFLLKLKGNDGINFNFISPLCSRRHLFLVRITLKLLRSLQARVSILMGLRVKQKNNTCTQVHTRSHTHVH